MLYDESRMKSEVLRAPQMCVGKLRQRPKSQSAVDRSGLLALRVGREHVTSRNSGHRRGKHDNRTRYGRPVRCGLGEQFELCRNDRRFSVDVLLSNSSVVNFTSIDNGTTAPYIFSITGSFGFVSNLLPMEAAGNDIALSGGQVVNPGDTWGLAHLRYLVDPSAPPGTVVGVMLEPTPVFLPPPGGTSLSDPTGAPVQFTSVNGTITITGTAIPEPASVTLLGISGVILLVGTRLARRGNTQCRD